MFSSVLLHPAPNDLPKSPCDCFFKFIKAPLHGVLACLSRFLTRASRATRRQQQSLVRSSFRPAAARANCCASAPVIPRLPHRAASRRALMSATLELSCTSAENHLIHSSCGRTPRERRWTSASVKWDVGWAARSG